jgi:transcriptional regulator with XRE-family HTH domain
MSEFSKKIKMLREDEGISQAELAEIIGTSKSSINMYERGEREPGLDTVKALADHFGVSADYLLGKEDKTKVKTAKKKSRGYEGLSDEEVESEIARLTASPAVALARREQRLKYKRRQILYTLRDLEKRGNAMMQAGITRELLDAMYNNNETEVE